MNYKINFYFSFIFINFTFLKQKDMMCRSFNNIGLFFRLGYKSLLKVGAAHAEINRLFNF